MYIHRALRGTHAFRLIELLPPRGEEIHPCLSMHEVTLEEHPSFTALSYTWGDAFSSHQVDSETQDDEGILSTRTVPISCDGDVIMVTPNLSAALHQLQQSSSGLFWIDAICINQDDIAEREAQVAIMGTIYSLAMNVVVWLGEEDSNSIEARHIISQMGPALEGEDDLVYFAELIQLRFDDPKAYSLLGIPVINVDSWLRFLVFFERRWFRRAWTFQEVVLAKEIECQCGSSKISFWHMGLVLYFLLIRTLWLFNMAGTQWAIQSTKPEIRDANHPAAAVCRVWAVRNIQQDGGAENSWMTPFIGGLVGTRHEFRKTLGWVAYMLNHSRDLQATDARDNLFAVLGVATKVPGSLFPGCTLEWPNYRKGPAAVYTEFAKFFITEVKSLGLLSMVQPSQRQRIRDLPSWVPDFSTGSVTPLIFQGTGDIFNASQNAEAILQFYPDINKLGFSACIWDTIVECGENIDMLSEGYLPFEADSLVVSHLDVIYKTGQARLEAYWRTLLADNTHSAYPAPEILGQSFSFYILTILAKKFGDQRAVDGTAQNSTLARAWAILDNLGIISAAIHTYNDFLRLKDCYQYLDPMASPESELGEIILAAERQTNPFVGSLRINYQERKIFRTKQNYLGLGYLDAKEGDTVCFAPGAQVPLILRSVSGNVYEFVGEAYLHGLMQGEAFADSKTDLHPIILV